jgi:ribosomal protein L7/L12
MSIKDNILDSDKDDDIEDLFELATLVNKKFNKLALKNLNIIQKNLSILPQKNKSNKLEELLFIILLKNNIDAIKTVRSLLANWKLAEAFVLMRVILERSALVFKGLHDHLTLEKIQQLSGNKCISELKKHFNIGRMYGFFSEIAHGRVDGMLIYIYILNSIHKHNNRKKSDLDVLFHITFSFIIEINLAVTEFLGKNYKVIKCGWIRNKQNVWVYKSKLSTSFGSSLPYSLMFIYRNSSGKS